MRPMFEKDWFDINFFTLGESPSIFSLPSPNFYRSFYKAFYEKYPNYESLSPKWLEEKGKLVKYLAPHCVDKNILSIGCGNGYVEHELAQINVKKIVAQDWSDVRPPNLTEKVVFQSGNLAHIDEKFDVIYASAVEYAMPNKDLIETLQSIKNCLRENGIFILISVSWDDCSNVKHFYRFVKSTAAIIYKYLFKKEKSLMWGWVRNKNEFETLLDKAGFKFSDPVKLGSSLIFFATSK